MKNILSILFILCTVFLSAQDKLSVAAIELTKDKVTYDGRYFSIPYPNGDVPKNLGVCSDVTNNKN